MTNYEKICAIINAGHIAVGKTDTTFCVFSHITTDGQIRYGTNSNLSSVLDSLGRSVADTRIINELKLTRIYALSRPLPKYKQGDKVVVLDNIKEINRPHTRCLGPGVTATVHQMEDNGMVHILSRRGISSFVLPQCIAPYFEDEPDNDVQKAIQLLTDKGVIKDGKILHL